MNPTATGWRRKKKTGWTVRVGDVLSRFIITVGGIGTILAVFTVCGFLVWVVAPLWRSAEISSPKVLPVSAPGMPLRLAMDEYQLIGWTLLDSGELVSFRLADGEIIERRPLFPGRSPTAFSFAIGDDSVVAGFADGAIAFGRIGGQTRFLDVAAADPALQALPVGGTLSFGQAVAQRISPSQFRLQELVASFDEPIAGASASPVRRLDHFDSSRERMVVVAHDDGVVALERISQRKNLLTRKITYAKEESILPRSGRETRTPPDFMVLSGLGDTVCLAWTDGILLRYDTRNAVPTLLEEVRVSGAPGTTLTAMTPLLGRSTLLLGDSTGRVRAWFPARTEGNASASEPRLVAAHEFPGHGSPVITLASSSRMRVMAIGHADGTLRLVHVTSGKRLGEVSLGPSVQPVRAICFAPKDDGFMALGNSLIGRWHMNARHPEITPSALFRPVWYEGAAKPEHVWQSSSGTDDFEPKYGLLPLIFGTLKATLFSMAFGLPIALLAAIFTSEFLHPSAKAQIKPLVELMASLPSVVLGFLAALVFAPIVAGRLAMLLAMFFSVPTAFLAGAYLWQMLPRHLALRFQFWRFACMFLALPAGVLAAFVLGPMLEHICFSGNIMQWLDGQIGRAAGGWFLLLLPVTALVAAFLSGRWVLPRFRQISMQWSYEHCAAVDALRMLLMAVAVLAVAVAGAFSLDLLGFDPRGGLFGRYDQRNALVVGFVMGFAIIPIIYTIAEDALSSVPEHLRSASLGAGATPWQTATRIIVPTAMSGLFSAVMIGLGRAVGETMIVLMAAGNTPVMDWNIFNGFRTLSANIAVELPEAVRNSTHYRTLFLAALVLFVMTFILNTIAEIVRIRFRKKAVEL